MNGGNTLGHVTTASVVGGALADLVEYALQIAHITPPDATTEAAIAVLFTVLASWVMQRMST
jgi:hypothetical protein